MRSTAAGEEQAQRMLQKIQALAESDPQLSSLVPSKAVGEAICEKGLSLAETMDRAFEGYADRAAVGCRDYDIVRSSESGKNQRAYKSSFKTLTYAEFQKRIHDVANAWRIDPVHGVAPDESVCIFGFTSVEYAVLDFATAYIQAITVPMQTGASGMDFDQILDSIRPVTVAATVSDLARVAHYVAGKDYIRSVVVFEYDERDDNDREAFERSREITSAGGTAVAMISMQNLELLGAASDWHRLEEHPARGERTASIVHSSGSTGKAKAAMISETAIHFYWISIAENAPPIVSLCLAPFSHLFGKGMLISVLKLGGTAYFTLAPDMSTLFEDIRIVRPTFLGFFPRIVELIYQHYQNEVARALRTSTDDEQAVRERVKDDMASSYLGDRLCFALFGGSQISPIVKDFFVDCFGIQLIDAYGNTEGGQVAVNGIIQRPPVLEYKIRSVPELGYYTTDKPYPRGELCFRSIQSISGYLNEPELSSRLFDENGLICTGDIVEEYEPDHIAIIDRRNEVLKLSQGEFVAVGTLGAIFEGGSELVDQIFIYGNSQQSYLLAVLVPNRAVILERLGDSAGEEALKSLLRDELQRVARQEGIRSFEVPKDFIVEPEPFNEKNGLLSGLRKKLRPALVKKYGERLEGMYDEREFAKRKQRLELADPHSSLSVREKLVRLLEVDLNIKVVGDSAAASFYELGGDSLGAVLYSLSIEEIFGVDMPADMILSPTGNLQKWAEYVQQILSGSVARPSFSSVHGKGVSEISESQLALSNFIEPEVLTSASDLPEAATESRTVLLTGANGFLGRFVCLAWLQKLSLIGGKLVCLVRAVDNASARIRVDEAFSGLDSELMYRYNELAGNHLEVLAGDVGDARIGLSEADYQRLSVEVDRVVHVAALVNHRLSYANLFGANVLGTAEIVRFSLCARKKPIDFVSTVAVYPLLDSSHGLYEGTPLASSISLSDDYAAGYGATKWAGEHLLRQAHREYRIPVNVFRGDMMLPHRVYKGQANTDDMFIRLLASIIYTGIAPYSFYTLKDDGTKRSGHYDGIPVDVVAAVVVAGEDGRNGYRTYNMENYHWDDGCSLDTFVDWIEAAGYSINKVADYQSWFREFNEKLSQLPEPQQQYSAIEIADAYATPQSSGNHTVNCDRFKALVARLPVDSQVPHLSQEYIAKCLWDMQLLGLVTPSRRS